MSNTILIKRSGTANAVPASGNLSLGELAINYQDGNLFYKDSGGTVQTIASKQFVSVSGNITGANVNATGLSLGGNVLSAINSTSNITTSANVSANYFLGNGRFLTGIDTTLISNGNATVQTLLNGNITVNPAGTPNVAVFSPSGVAITGAVSATGNITGNYFFGNGSQLTGVAAASVNAAALTGNTLSSNILFSSLTTVGTLTSLSVSGNTTTGNLSSGGIINTTGNIAGGNITTAGQVSAAATITGGNLATGGTASVTGNITGGNVNTGGLSLSGNVLSAINSTSNITTTANVAAGNLLTDGLYHANGTPWDFQQPAGSNTQIQFNDGSGGFGASANLTFNSATDVLTVTGTASVTGNVNASAISASGNITGGNVRTGGLVSAAGNLTAANVNTGILSLSGNVISDINTTSNIKTTATVTSGNVAATYVSASGNVDGGNVNVGTKLYTANIVGKVDALTFESVGNGNINLYPNGTGNVVLANTYINGLQLTPQQDADAASKYYVDIMTSTALVYHQAVFVATTANLASTTGGTITYNQPNGAGNGIGATLTTTGSFNIIDSANVQTAGTRILVKNEANAVHNGVYVWSNATVITRSSDADEYGTNNAEQFSINDYFFVSSGNINLGSAYVVDAPTGVITFGTSNIQFAQFSQAQIYSANTNAGLSLIAQTFNAKVDNTTTAFDGGGNIVVKASAQLTTPNIGAATGTSLSVTGTVTAGNIDTGTGFVSTTGNIVGGNINTGGVVSATGNIISSGNVAAGNITTTGLISATSTVTGGNIATAGTVSATGNVTGGNLITGGLITASGNIVTTANISGNNIAGTLTTAAQPNVTSLGVLGALLVANTVLADGYSARTGSDLPIQVLGANANILIKPNGTGITDFNNKPIANISTISASGNVTGGNIVTVGNVTGGNVLFGSGMVSGTGNIYGGNIFQGPNQVLDTTSTVDGGLY